jgi:uncharacterized protein involved in response to NO
VLHTKHTEFYAGYVGVALTTALLVGFAIGAHLTFVLGFGFPIRRGFSSFIQVHGHVQLVGWAGMFIMGISLHFIPRLAGVPIARPAWVTYIPWFMGAGLALRSIGQSCVPYLTESSLFPYILWLVAASGWIEWGGILLYVFLLLETFGSLEKARAHTALRSVRPYFGMMVAGWTLYACLNLVLLVHMALGQAIVVHDTWNQFAMQSFVGLVLLPVAFAFSLRMLPLYLRLAVPDWPVRGTAYAYLVALAIQVVPTAPPFLQMTPQVAMGLSNLGMVLKGGVILWFVWRLDVLTRRREPWIVHRKLHPGPERRPTRPDLPDYGEFGRFERLVYTAYIWLVLAASGEMVAGLSGLSGWGFFISSSAIRHMYLLGFITMLIMGMAVRMLPGFWHKRQVASAALVDMTFWLGNAAVVCRLLLFLLPPALLQAIPGAASGARAAFGFSGLLGLAAICCLTVNLWRTGLYSARV